MPESASVTTRRDPSSFGDDVPDEAEADAAGVALGLAVCSLLHAMVAATSTAVLRTIKLFFMGSCCSCRGND
jgi:hypothetical protein